MAQPVYDEHADTYDDKHREAVSASGFDVSHFYEYKIKEIQRVLCRHGIAGQSVSLRSLARNDEVKTILDFGCGVGNVDPYIRKYFPEARIFGIDISEESVKLARVKNESYDISYAALDVSTQNASPFDVKFDLVFVSCVFQHVPNEQHHFLMEFFERNMNTGAYLFIFEHNPFNPVTRSVFSKWDRKIDENADLYPPAYLKKLAEAAGFRIAARKFTVFFPKVLSSLAPLEKYIGWIPFGAQYYIIAEKKYAGD